MSWVPEELIAEMLLEYGLDAFEEASDSDAFSDDFAQATYIKGRELMLIKFIKGAGKQYSCHVTEDEWANFRDSTDRGAYWNTNMRGRV